MRRDQGGETEPPAAVAAVAGDFDHVELAGELAKGDDGVGL
jgi:hypothetical protein